MRQVGWDDPRTAEYYAAFEARHGRYAAANEALVANSAIGPRHRVLDHAAGLGGTAAAVLPRLGSEGRVVSVEPAAAMREAGAARLADPRIEWRERLPPDSFDRVLVGAAIWQMTPLAGTLATLAAHVAPGGALVFDVPAAYLGEADEAGGGEDPFLTSLPGFLAEGRELPQASAVELPDAEGVVRLLRDLGLRPERWEIRRRMTQAEYRDWLKIPPISDRILAGLSPAERATRIDAAWERADASSWRWERWLGFTAWNSA